MNEATQRMIKTQRETILNLRKLEKLQSERINEQEQQIEQMRKALELSYPIVSARQGNLKRIAWTPAGRDRPAPSAHVMAQLDAAERAEVAAREVLVSIPATNTNNEGN